MLKKNICITVVSIVIAGILTFLTPQKTDCGTYPSRCLDCYCGWKVGGWPLKYLSLEGGALRMYGINYLYLLLDFVFFFILAFALLSLVLRLIAYYSRK